MDVETVNVTQTLVELGLSVLGVVVTAIVIPFLHQAGKKVNSWLESKSHMAAFQCANERLMAVVENAVLSIEQTLVKELRAASADGSISQAEYAHIKASAISLVKEVLGKEGMVEIMGCLKLPENSVNSLISMFIESAIQRAKSK